MRSNRTSTAAAVVFTTVFAPACGAGRGNDGSGSASAGAASATQGTDDGTTAGASTEDGPTAGASTSQDSSGAHDDSDGGTGSLKLDVGMFPDVAPLEPVDPCGNAGGGDGGGAVEPDFSYIWIANSSQDTVSKVNTSTLVEEGRYRTRPAAGGSPSRTSVSLNGDVAIANRSGGVTKIHARLDDCPDPTNTSAGAADIKPFPDGCVAWHTPFFYVSQRPVAWTSGEWNEETCRWENEKLWTSGANATIDVLLLDGETGVVEQTIPILEVPPGYYGIYGAAADVDGNFWGSQLGLGDLVFVDRVSLAHEVWPMVQSGYGMTVDQNGRVWTCSTSGAARFDPATSTWLTTLGVSGGGGCMADADGRLWMSNHTQMLVAVDVETLLLSTTIPIPQYSHGISIDWEGNIWGVTMGSEAYRVNPDDATVDTVGGFVGPYTYSDMTGWALSNTVGPPPAPSR